MSTRFTILGLSSTPSCSNVFSISSVYSNLDYLFWRKNEIEHLELDRDPYQQIIWYYQKARNDKLFRGITRDPLEPIRHAQSECHAYFQMNSKTNDDAHPPHQTHNTQALWLQSICLVDGSWTSEPHYSGYRWV